jgi:hypothetical protein
MSAKREQAFVVGRSLEGWFTPLEWHSSSGGGTPAFLTEHQWLLGG